MGEDQDGSGRMTGHTPIEAIAKAKVDFMGETGETVAILALAALTAAGYAVVPIKPSERMLEELARIGDGPLISGGEVWGYMLAAALGEGAAQEGE